MVGAGFHPDTSFSDYVGLDGAQTFPGGTADNLDAILQDCMMVLGPDDCYRIAGDCVYECVAAMRAALIELDALPT